MRRTVLFLALFYAPYITQGWLPTSLRPPIRLHKKASGLKILDCESASTKFPSSQRPRQRLYGLGEVRARRKNVIRKVLFGLLVGMLVSTSAGASTLVMQPEPSTLMASVPAANSALAAGSYATPLAAGMVSNTRLIASPVSIWTEFQLTARLLYAAAVGAAVGKERSAKTRHTAGIRTMALVSLGAAAFTICSAYGFRAGDPSRMESNVASGVGFVGAGVITTSSSTLGDRKENFVHGLTTAAAIWLR